MTSILFKTIRRLVLRQRHRRLRELFGKLEWNTAFDYKDERTRD